MQLPSPNTDGRWLDLLDPLRIVRVLLHRRTRLVIAWVVALLVAWSNFQFGWYCMATDKRHDGNSAHVNIDFSGQYLLGRMVLEGEGPFLYHRRHQAPVLQRAYPIFGEDPEQKSRDWHDVEEWMIGRNDIDDSLNNPDKDDLGGPLYPPVHALLFAPLTLLSPLLAYRTVQIVTIFLTFFVSFLAERITAGRMWWPVALVLLFFLPGYMGALGLGQNPLFTLTLLMAGWWLVTTDRPIAGGIVWGFLAYKPVWAVAFLPVLLVTGRFRASAAMVLTGLWLGVLTLPFVGWQCWFDWLHMGQIASDRYSWDQNWLLLSRDLLNLPRRPFIAHDENHQPSYPYGKALPDFLSHLLLCRVMGVTLVVALLRRRQVSVTGGPGPAFLLFAGWMSCLHFMYYDMQLTFLPLVVLFGEPSRFLQVRLLPAPREPLPPELRAYYQPTSLEPSGPLPLLGKFAVRWAVNPLPPLLLLVMLLSVPIMIWYDPGYHFPPMDTFCILGLWAWCGWAVWHDRSPPVETLEVFRDDAYRPAAINDPTHVV